MQSGYLVLKLRELVPTREAVLCTLGRPARNMSPLEPLMVLGKLCPSCVLTGGREGDTEVLQKPKHLPPPRKE